MTSAPTIGATRTVGSLAGRSMRDVMAVLLGPGSGGS